MGGRVPGVIRSGTVQGILAVIWENPYGKFHDLTWQWIFYMLSFFICQPSHRIVERKKN